MPRTSSTPILTGGLYSKSVTQISGTCTNVTPFIPVIKVQLSLCQPLYLWGLPSFATLSILELKSKGNVYIVFCGYLSLSRLLLHGHGTIGFPTCAQRVITTPWQCNMCFKQWVIKEFLVAEKESGTNIHKQSNYKAISCTRISSDITMY